MKVKHAFENFPRLTWFSKLHTGGGSNVEYWTFRAPLWLWNALTPGSPSHFASI